MAWTLLDVNVALLVWMGIGGMTAALAGPLIVGSLWKGVTERGALFGMLTGFVVFALLHTQSIPVRWLLTQGPNPFACSALAGMTGVVVSVGVSSLLHERRQ